MSIQLKPVAGKLVISPVKPETCTKGGILLPDVAKTDQDLGHVVVAGEGVPADWLGRIVLYTSYAGQPFKLDNQSYLIVDKEDVLAVDYSEARKEDVPTDAT